MARLTNPFISGRHQSLISFLIWLAIFISGAALIGWFGVAEVQSKLRRATAAEVAPLEKLRVNVNKAFKDFHADVTARPCSSEFRSQLRRLAFRPDGISEFLYAPNGYTECSTTRQRFEPPVSFGPPDVKADEDLGYALWFDRDLEFIGLQGVRGTIALKEPFALVIPIQTTEESTSQWIKKELVMHARGDNWWHSGGHHGVYKRHLASKDGRSPHSQMLGTLRELTCDQQGLHCIAAEASLTEMLVGSTPIVAFAVLMLGMLSASAASGVRSVLMRYWSLETRFCRNLNSKSLICAYQPIMNLKTGVISGCEVLARWRDVDGTIVPPDKFIKLVEEKGRTRQFTKLMIDKAYAELSSHIAPKHRLQINFNIFPRDLDSAVLLEMFSSFTAAHEPFDVAVEIIETDTICMEDAQREVQALSLAGVKTYIDDFGSGYSSIHRVAALSVEGVKLDRTFAMAPDDSMMARMIVHALEIVKTSGRTIVVEGVESLDRLELLRHTKQVDYVQGYLISKPLPIDAFAQFLVSYVAPRQGTVRAA
jgi:sensor c-di-GMP phosphodiesterase-like protein